MKLYYTDNGVSIVADLSIVDTASGCRCEADILGNMGFASDGTGIHRVPEWEEDCDTDIASAAFAASATHYADSAEDAQWWIDYVDGYNASMDDIAELSETLNDLGEDTLQRICLEIGADPERGQLDPVRAIIEALHESGVDYEDERAAFMVNLERLMALIGEAK